LNNWRQKFGGELPLDIVQYLDGLQDLRVFLGLSGGEMIVEADHNRQRTRWAKAVREA
jgi:hypothetical protein